VRSVNRCYNSTCKNADTIRFARTMTATAASNLKLPRGSASAAQYAREAIKINREKSKVTETRYKPEFAEEVCRRMAEGASLREVCRDNGMPESSVRQWVRDDRDGFAARYQAARALQVESWSDQIIEIANREDLDPQDRLFRGSESGVKDVFATPSRTQ
jgi:hypothetical protein